MTQELQDPQSVTALLCTASHNLCQSCCSIKQRINQRNTNQLSKPRGPQPEPCNHCLSLERDVLMFTHRCGITTFNLKACLTTFISHNLNGNSHPIKRQLKSPVTTVWCPCRRSSRLPSHKWATTLITSCPAQAQGKGLWQGWPSQATCSPASTRLLH